ncbi:hypothetical protein [Candidatus Thiodiazotropha endoloripes]|uniref:hypothetical protein n=1 Tax=Candidatus Thiodiazotropha endoloripes TaxID=1818881 RepID=UPI00114CDF53|nr:hypothetical protein [Candidatus Thiodiazotropha endoloripes]MCG7983778.1 hypothetical protein [Candidatus Thiodiazotropha lotti]
MKKLFNLKKWLTIEEAAKHLSILFSEDVSEADVLRLGLDGHLTLSVNFVNHALGRIGHVVPIKQAKMYITTSPTNKSLPEIIKKDVLSSDIDDLPDDIRIGLDNKELVLTSMGNAISEHEVIEYTDKIATLTGIWDLPMLGSEILDIEHTYQQLTGGPAVTLTCLDGAFVKSSDGRIANIQETFDDNEFQTGSMAQLEKIKEHIAENNITPEKANSMLEKHKKDREVYLEKKKAENQKDQYYPAGKLPDDSILVVRTRVLRDFEQTLSNNYNSNQKELKPNERNSLLTIIAALCHYSKIDLDTRGVAVRISKLTDEIGAPVSDDTVRRVLEKIPDALETRLK